MGALKVLIERAATPGADNADIRSLALTTIQHLSSNGSNMAQLQGGEVATRLKGLKAHLKDDVAVGRAVEPNVASPTCSTGLLPRPEQSHGAPRQLRRLGSPSDGSLEGRPE